MIRLTDLYLAYRQAKRISYWEGQSHGLLDYAKYESRLLQNLRYLEMRTGGVLFDGIAIGKVELAPKKMVAPPNDNSEVINIGRPAPTASKIEVRSLIVPSIEFSISEILFIWKYGAIWDSLLSSSCMGYRLYTKYGDGSRLRTSYSFFEPWQEKYREFRARPLHAARALLRRTPAKSLWIASLDFASYYDSIDATFITSAIFVAIVETQAKALGVHFDRHEYIADSQSLLSCYAIYHRELSTLFGTVVTRGIPIGSIVSRLIANLALRSLDARIEGTADVHCYRRYVDDILLVADLNSNQTTSMASVLSQWLPLLPVQEDELLLDSEVLDRRGSNFRLQTKKLAIYALKGLQGADFLDGIETDLRKVSSERNRFMDPRMFRSDTLLSLARDNASPAPNLRVLREVDKRRLAKHEFNTGLRSLQTIATLVDKPASTRMISSTIEPIIRMLGSAVDWVERQEVMLRLLKIALLAEDWKSAAELIEHTNLAWGSISALQSTATVLVWHGHVTTSMRALGRLSSYLHGTRLDAVCATFPLISHVPSDVTLELAIDGKVLSHDRIRAYAIELAVFDLRAVHKEEEALPFDRDLKEWSELEQELRLEGDLSDRFDLIMQFITRCRSLDDKIWNSTPARLFVSTRPPSYFDVSWRWLANRDESKHEPDLFDRLVELVNAIRGTKYKQAGAEVIDSRTVHIRLGEMEYATSNSRIILGNLVLKKVWSDAALSGSLAQRVAGSHSYIRLRDISAIINRVPEILRLKRDYFSPSAVLVLPELGVPRRWVRSIAVHFAKRMRCSIIMGMEYYRNGSVVYNQVIGVFPAGFSMATTWLWTKRHPANSENSDLQRAGVRFPDFRGGPRTIIDSSLGRFSVLICSELIESGLIAGLRGHTDLIIVPSWNQDTPSYDHLIRSVGLQTHSFVAISNNGAYSDCRIWAPFRARWQQDVCRFVNPRVNDVIWVDLPVAKLRHFHSNPRQNIRAEKEDEPTGSSWKPLPPDWPHR